jgi:hypothetical protein
MMESHDVTDLEKCGKEDQFTKFVQSSHSGAQVEQWFPDCDSSVPSEYMRNIRGDLSRKKEIISHMFHYTLITV